MAHCSMPTSLLRSRKLKKHAWSDVLYNDIKGDFKKVNDPQQNCARQGNNSVCCRWRKLCSPSIQDRVVHFNQHGAVLCNHAWKGLESRDSTSGTQWLGNLQILMVHDSEVRMYFRSSRPLPWKPLTSRMRSRLLSLSLVLLRL